MRSSLRDGSRLRDGRLRSVSLRVESLEERRVLSVAPPATLPPDWVPAGSTPVATLEAKAGQLAAQVVQGPTFDDPSQFAVRTEGRDQGFAPAPNDGALSQAINGPDMFSSNPPTEVRGAAPTLETQTPTSGAPTPGSPAPPTTPSASPGAGPESGDFYVFRNTLQDDTQAFLFPELANQQVASYNHTLFQATGTWAWISGDNGASYRAIDSWANFGPGWTGVDAAQSNVSGGLTIWGLSKGDSILIAVSNSSNRLMDNSWTYYTFQPSSFGFSNSWSFSQAVEIEVTTDFLYFNAPIQGDSNVLCRIPLTQLYQGGGINYTYWSTPGLAVTMGMAQNSTDDMYLAAVNGTNAVRIYRQPFNTNSLTSFDVGGLNTTYFGGLDLKITGMWVSGNELGMMWNSAWDGTVNPGPRDQNFVRVLRYDRFGGGVISQPDIYNNTVTWSSPRMAVNQRGHVSGTVRYAGNLHAADLAVVIDDDLNGDPASTGWEAYIVGSSGGFTGSNYYNFSNAAGGALRNDLHRNTWLGSGGVIVGSGENDLDLHSVWWGRGRDYVSLPPYYDDIGDTIGSAIGALNGAGTNSYANALWTPATGRADVDMYRVVGFMGDTFHISTAPNSFYGDATYSDTMLRVFDANGNELAFNDDATTAYADLTYTLPASGVYYVGVSGFNNRFYSPFVAGSGALGSTGDYWITLTLTSYDYGDYAGQADSIDGGETVSNALGNGIYGAADIDVFWFLGLMGDTIDLNAYVPAGGASVPMVVSVFDEEYNLVGRNFGGTNVQMHLTLPATSYFYIAVSGLPNYYYNVAVPGTGSPGATGDYALQFNLTPGIDVGDTGSSALVTGLRPGNGSFTAANPIGSYETGLTDRDLYYLEGQAGEIIDIRTSAVSITPVDTVLRLFDNAGNQLAIDDQSGGANFSHIANYVLPATGGYWVGVSGSGNDFYDLNGNFAIEGPLGDYQIDIEKYDVVGPRIYGIQVTNSYHGSVPRGNGEQLRTLPVGPASYLSVFFDQDVEIDISDLRLVGALHGEQAVVLWNYSPGFSRGTLYFAQPLPADQYTLYVNADGAGAVRDRAGNQLDGEWDNPTDIFDTISSTISGNGVPGGNFAFKFTILPGDANRDLVVSGADYTIWADHFGQDVPSGFPLLVSPYSYGDFNDDQHVTGADYTIWADHFGVDLRGLTITTGDENFAARHIAGSTVEQGPVASTIVARRERVDAAPGPAPNTSTSGPKKGQPAVVVRSTLRKALSSSVNDDRVSRDAALRQVASWLDTLAREV